MNAQMGIIGAWSVLLNQIDKLSSPTDLMKPVNVEAKTSWTSHSVYNGKIIVIHLKLMVYGLSREFIRKATRKLDTMQ